MSRGKSKIFKTNGLMNPRQAGQYMRLLYSWETNADLSESKGKGGSISTIRRDSYFFKKEGWIDLRKIRRRFSTKKGNSWRWVVEYGSNIQAFIDYLLRKDGKKYENLRDNGLCLFLNIFFELEDTRKNILKNSISKLSHEMEFNSLKNSKNCWEINFNEAVNGFKECIDNDFIFYLAYFKGYFKLGIDYHKQEFYLIKNYFSKTQLKIKRYLKNGKKSQFEKRVEIINQFTKEFDNWKDSKDYYDFQTLRNLSNIIRLGSNNAEYETKIRLFVGCLYDSKYFEYLKKMFLGTTAKRLLMEY